jgi:chromosomal replication initiation ATPase DnaA
MGYEHPNVHNLKLTVELCPPTINILLTIPEAKNVPRTESDTDRILEDISTRTGISVDRIKSPSREDEVVKARDRVIWRLWEELGMSTTGIGQVLNRDHSTIVTSLRRTRAAAELPGPGS